MANNVKIEAGMCKYPKEVFSALTSTKTFSVRGELFPADAIKGRSPYKMYDGVFSRFVFTIINKSKGGPTTFPDGNISVDEIPGLIENTKAAKNADTFLTLPFIGQVFSITKNTANLVKRCGDAINMVYSFMKTGKEPVRKNQTQQQNVGNLAKTVQIANGTFKGKTPFQVLLEDSSKAKDLQSQYSWLQSNLEKYPNNKSQMDAIQEALYMAQNGMINAENGGLEATKLELGDVVLYEALPKALIRKQDKNGFCPVYEIGIIWHIGDKYPVEVIVKNYKAPVNKSDKGTINPMRQKAIEIVTNNFRMSSNQWFECLYAMKSHMRRFESLHAVEQFNQASVADRVNREAAKSEINNTGSYYSNQNQPAQQGN